MNKYALAAIETTKQYAQENQISPRIAWDQVTTHIFGKGTSSQEKGCPRDAFLGLCEEGLVKDIPPGNYCNSSKNKRYALTAVELLKQDPTLSNQPPLCLWERVMKGEQKAHNSQMDVVIALWKANLLIPKNAG